MHGAWYCRPECLERAVSVALDPAHAGSGRNTLSPHRIPLGLLLLSRQQLTADQLRHTLETQRNAGRGKIGEWLQHLGYASEWQVTAALARQWGCPMLRNGREALGANRRTSIPLRLLESFQMIPLDFAAATQTLLIAFSEGLDHSILYAVEQMLGYRTGACFVCPSILRESLQAMAQVRSGDVVFDRIQDFAESALIIKNYALKVAADEVRIARCSDHVWIRLERRGRESVNLVLRTPSVETRTVNLLNVAAYNSRPDAAHDQFQLG